MSEFPNNTPEFDPNNGFETVWKFENKDKKNRLSLYSLVKMPRSVPISIQYEKPSFSLILALSPTEDIFTWDLQGIIDPDIIEAFGLPVSKPRIGKSPPEINSTDIKIIEKYGEIQPVTEGGNLLKVHLKLDADRLYDFFHRIWRPIDQNVPEYYVGGNKWDQRILPQKHVRGSRLSVIRVP